MTEPTESFAEAGFLAAPRDPSLVALYRYWEAKRGANDVPSRADIDPAELKPLLPHIILYDALGPGSYRIRLVGEAIVAFVGRNLTGHDATTSMTPGAAANMRMILDAVCETRSPRFRAGKAYWLKEKAYRDYEACFLPLAPPGQPVNMILGGLSFAA